MNRPAEGPDPFGLARFHGAQDPVIDEVIAELSAGEKTSHWMWFVFPQLRGLGRSAMSERYAIASRAEALAYLADPILRARLERCAELVIAAHPRPLRGILGTPDDQKFHASMTLFASVAEAGSVFERALQTFFDGRGHPETLARR